MGTILVIDNQDDAAQSLVRLFNAVGLKSSVADTFASALRLYSAVHTTAVFLNPSTPRMDVQKLLEEFEAGTTKAGKERPPVIFIYTSDEVLQKSKIKDIPRSSAIKKPVPLVEVYQMLHALELVGQPDTARSDEVRDKILQFSKTYRSTAIWLQKLKSQIKIQ